MVKLFIITCSLIMVAAALSAWLYISEPYAYRVIRPTNTPYVYTEPTVKIVNTPTRTVPSPTPVPSKQRVSVSYDSQAPSIIRPGSIIMVVVKVRNESNTDLNGFQIEVKGDVDKFRIGVVENHAAYDNGLGGLFSDIISTSRVAPGSVETVTVLMQPKVKGSHVVKFDGYGNEQSFRIYVV